MQTFDQALATLVREQLVAPDVALHYASSPTDFRRSIGMLG
jgi:Tfp pilus assembly ATPase PilU